MDLTEEFDDISVGTYRCLDLAANLSIKITINNKGAANSQTEEAIIQWQQKLFSPPELEQYGALETAETDLQKRFKEEATRLRAAAQPPNNSIFTHIQQEDFVADYERSRQLLKPAPRPSKMADTLMDLRYRGPPPLSDEGPDTGPGPDQEPSDHPTITSVEQRLRSLSFSRTESMFIMLYAQEEEHVLCRLDWSHSGVLTVRPDFSPGSRPYRLQVGEGQKGVYAYRLQWVPPADEGRPAGLSTQSQQPAAVRHREPVPRAGPAPEFPLPSVGSLLVAVSGELVSARGFQRDNLFIHYFIEMPKGWRASADTPLSGITQLSRAPPGQDAHFGFPITAELVFESSEDDDTDCQRWPALFLEVLSEDALGVPRTEGYCHVTLPAAAGGRSLRLAAWRPVGDRQAQLRRHFIGGSPELEDPSFVAVPAGFQGSRLSRYGFRTETTGQVAVRLWALHQSQSWAADGGGRPAGLQTGPPGGVGAVLEAFRCARLRMLRARQQLDSSAGGTGRDRGVSGRTGQTSVSVG